jgi:tripeptide aminopeptidase
MKELLASEKIQKALLFLKNDDARTLAEQLELVQIPAPSHQEKERAHYVLNKFEKAGLTDVHMDEVWNVFGTIKGSGQGPALLIAGHTDTVFPAGTDLTIKREGSRYIAPGIGDDTRAVAELISLARAMVANDIHGEGDIVLCANVCEEGLGDLKGVKHIFKKTNAFKGFVSVDNPIPGGIVYTATGSVRFQISFHGPGGHSFADFGIPSPIHALGRTIAAIADFSVPEFPKTTFNVGVIKGGTSINTVSESASMLVDIRSDSSLEIQRLTSELKTAVDSAVQSENNRGIRKEKISADVEMVGNRPAGTQDPQCSIVQAAWKAALAVGLVPELRNESSTDANVPISLGIPAICVGRGGLDGANHTLHEWYENVGGYLAIQRDLLLTLALSGFEGYREYQL